MNFSLFLQTAFVSSFPNSHFYFKYYEKICKQYYLKKTIGKTNTKYLMKKFNYAYGKKILHFQVVILKFKNLRFSFVKLSKFLKINTLCLIS